MSRNASLITHHPADQSAVMADFQTSASALLAWPPSQWRIGEMMGMENARVVSGIAQVLVAAVDGRVGVGPDGRRADGLGSGADHPPAPGPHHALAVGNRGAGG